MDSLRRYIKERQLQGVKKRTINSALQVIKPILNIAEYRMEG